MGKLTKIDNWKDALKIKIQQGIDPKKFDIKITAEIFIKNKWEAAVSTKGNYDGWCPPEREWVYDDKAGDWKPDECDFDECFVYYRPGKDAWCYQFNFGTYVYDIKSIAELEIILAREGFVYSFDI